MAVVTAVSLSFAVGKSAPEEAFSRACFYRLSELQHSNCLSIMSPQQSKMDFNLLRCEDIQHHKAYLMARAGDAVMHMHGWH